MDMKKIFSHIALVLVLAVMLSSCDVIGGIFEAGFYTAIILLVIVVVLVVWLLRKFRGGRRRRDVGDL